MLSAPKKLQVVNILDEIPTGHKPLKVVGSDFHYWVLKHGRDNFPDFDLINEIICHYLLKIWGLNTPEIAYFSIDPVHIKALNSPNHLEHNYKNEVFGSCWIEGQELNALIPAITSKHDYNKLTKPSDYFKIALFDIWVDNDDRTPENFNMIYSNKNHFYAIDHAFTFTSRPYTDLTDFVSITHNSSILHAELACSLIRYKRKDYDLNKDLKDYFYFCIEKCAEYYDEICTYIPDTFGFDDTQKEALKRFLFSKDRNASVFNTFLNFLPI